MKPGPAMPLDAARRLIAAALEEDLGDVGDLTSDAVIPENATAEARLVAREPLVVAGLPVAELVFRTIDAHVRTTSTCADGDAVEGGTTIATVHGPGRAILAGERTALNFMMRMSGVATTTREAVREVAGTGAAILDTRKTIPGWRALDKYAVAVGGGDNHRMGLYDAVMVKDTHVGVVGSVGEAVRAALAAGNKRETTTAEVRTVEELHEAIAAGAGRVLLDNMTPTELREAAVAAAGRVVLEASGGLRPGALRAVAETGVDCLSLGALTHSARAADIAMEIDFDSDDTASPSDRSP